MVLIVVSLLGFTRHAQSQVMPPIWSNFCYSPWNSPVQGGTSVTAYSSATPAAACTSVSETRTCNGGSLSGSFTFQTCVDGCTAQGISWNTNCTGISSALSNGGSSSVTNNAGGYTGSVTVTCNSGTLHQSGASCSSSTHYMYVINKSSNNVTVINSTTNLVSSTIAVGAGPSKGVLLGTKVYITNTTGNSVSVIDTSTNSVTSTIAVGSAPNGICSSGAYLFVSNNTSNNVSVINPATNAVVSAIAVGSKPYPVACNNGYVYVPNYNSGTTSVINSSSLSVVATIAVGINPADASVVGNQVYVTGGGHTSVIDATSNTLTTTIPNSAYRAIQVGSTNYGYSTGPKALYAIDATTNTIIATITTSSFITNPVYAGGKIYGTINSGLNPGGYYIVDPTLNILLSTVSIPNTSQYAIAHGTYYYIVNSYSNAITVMDMTTNTVAATLAVGAFPLWIIDGP